MSYVGAADRPDGCLFCDALASSDDRKVLVLLRRPLAFLILNAFPYASGHLMAALTRHVGTLGVATAGVEGHLHVHVVPRWNGDTNFMPVLGEVRVLPESLDATHDRLSSALSTED